MQTENLLEQDLSASPDKTPESKSKKTNLWIWAHIITFLLGLALLVFVVYKYRADVVETVPRIGWGFLIILGLNVLRHFLRSASMYLAVSPEVRTFKYRSAVAARFGGEAVNFFTFTGPFLGDATKAVLLKRNLSLTHGASAVIIDNILYYVSVILVVLTGVAALLVTYGSNGSTMNNVLLIIVLLSVTAFAALSLAILYRVKPLTHAIDFLARRNFAPNFLIKRRHNILDVETNVFQFYHHRRLDFFTIFGISMSVHVVSVTEVYLALKFLGFDAFVTTAFIVESLTKVINAVFSFIPGTIGVYEGGNGIILKTLGYTTAVGVALALVRRAAILFSTFIGLVILTIRALMSGARHLANSPD